MMMKLKLTTLTIVLITLFSCGGGAPAPEQNATTDATENATPADPMSDKGIGPITLVDVSAAVNPDMAKEGEGVFTAKCTACHKMGKRYIGPDLTEVTSRRSPEWIMNMILNPVEMVAKNEIAKKLIAEYTAPMANQNLTEDEARKVLEFFRTLKK